MKYLGLLAVLLLVAGCAGTPVPPPPKGSSDRPAAAAAADSGNSQAAAQKDEQPPARPTSDTADETLFQAAYRQTSFDNPRRDFTGALQGFDAYIKRYPNGARLKEAKNWRFILKTILDLQSENVRLNRKIDELKQIDIIHEEKRDQ